MNCWICGNLADSKEHKFKKRLIVSRFGKGPFGRDELLYINDDEQIRINGPDQAHLKFNASICSDCNNNKTQPFDKSYDQFYDYIYNNEKTVIKQRFIDFKAVYHDHWQTQQLNLFKYFVKILGCRIVEANLTVPNDLQELLFKDSFQTGLYINFAINEDKLLFIDDFRDCVGYGSILTTVNFLNNHTNPKFYFTHYFSFLIISFWYAFEPDGKLGSFWCANSRYIYLGSHEPLSNELRNELLQEKTH